MSSFEKDLSAALQLIATRCPRLVAGCYWAGTSAIAIEELHHRESFDLDFHTRKALASVTPLLAEVEHALSGRFELISAPDEYGSSFQGLLAVDSGRFVTLEVLSNHEDVSAIDMVDATTAAGLKRVSLERYLADKIQCVCERVEVRDLFDVETILKTRRDLQSTARDLVARQDLLILTERLLGWTDDAIASQLTPYPELSAVVVRQSRARLLSWVKELS